MFELQLYNDFEVFARLDTDVQLLRSDVADADANVVDDDRDGADAGLPAEIGPQVGPVDLHGGAVDLPELWIVVLELEFDLRRAFVAQARWQQRQQQADDQSRQAFFHFCAFLICLLMTGQF